MTERGVRADAVRLAFGTLSIIRMRPPKAIDQARAGVAMTLAPVVAAVLATIAGAAGLLLQRALPASIEALGLLALLAFLTRALHLDGLADVADGLGSGKDAEAARAVMKRSDIGPFGVVTLLFVVGLQWQALALLLAHGRGLAALVLALLVSRLVLTILCSRGIPAASTTGLGRYVANSVRGGQLLVAVIVAGGLVSLLWLIDGGFASQRLLPVDAAMWGSIAGVVVGVGFGVRCIRRFGGITGDVLGACVELSMLATLLATAATT